MAMISAERAWRGVRSESGINKFISPSTSDSKIGDSSRSLRIDNKFSQHEVWRITIIVVSLDIELSAPPRPLSLVSHKNNQKERNFLRSSIGINISPRLLLFMVSFSHSARRWSSECLRQKNRNEQGRKFPKFLIYISINIVNDTSSSYTCCVSQ